VPHLAGYHVALRRCMPSKDLKCLLPPFPPPSPAPVPSHAPVSRPCLPSSFSTLSVGGGCLALMSRCPVSAPVPMNPFPYSGSLNRPFGSPLACHFGEKGASAPYSGSLNGPFGSPLACHFGEQGASAPYSGSLNRPFGSPLACQFGEQGASAPYSGSLNRPPPGASRNAPFEMSSRSRCPACLSPSSVQRSSRSLPERLGRRARPEIRRDLWP
jgi:hypothetical protein